MKKIASILLIVLVLAALCSCSKVPAPVDVNDPNTKMSQIIEVPYQFDLSSYIDIEREDYFGIEYERVDTTVSDEELDEAVYALLEENATLTDVTDRGAKNGDTLVIDFTGYIDGVAFDNGAAENYEMVLGEAGFIPGFEDALVGHKAGEEFNIDVTFPEEYKEDTAGKAAVFAIKIHSIKEKVLPELNDEFAKKAMDCDTVSALLVKLGEELAAQKQANLETEKQNRAFDVVYGNVTIKDYPKTEYKYYYDDFVSYYETVATNYYNMTLSEYIEAVGSTEDEFYEYADMNAASMVEQELIFFYIAKEEGLIDSITKADYDAFLKEMAALYNTDPVDFEAQYQQGEIFKALVFETAMDFVVANGTEVEPKAETDETATESIESTDATDNTEAAE